MNKSLIQLVDKTVNKARFMSRAFIGRTWLESEPLRDHNPVYNLLELTQIEKRRPVDSEADIYYLLWPFSKRLQENSFKIRFNNLCIWFGTWKVRRLNLEAFYNRSRVNILGQARTEERLSRSKLRLPFWIDSEAFSPRQTTYICISIQYVLVVSIGRQTTVFDDMDVIVHEYVKYQRT